MSEIGPDVFKKWKLHESSLIKSIRRGMVDDAVYWACLICRIGNMEKIWRRLFIHLSEDIGVANANLPTIIRSLYENYLFLVKTNKSAFEGENAEILPVIHAVILMAKSKKSRAVDNAITVHYRSVYKYQENPDYATDYHSPAGRAAGRGVNHFLNVAGKINNETSSFVDLWKEDAFKLLEDK